MNLVCGSGMIAKAFQNKQSELENVIIFAKGVSNSSEIRELEFSREICEIEKHIGNKEKTLIYFSTCSINDGDCNTPYKRHKKNIEKYIANNSQNYLIFRLPQVVGVSANNTILPKFIESTLNRTRIDIQSNARRYLIDVDDVVNSVIDIIKRKKYNNKIIEICSGYDVAALDLFIEVAKVLGHSAAYQMVSGGEVYHCQNFECKNLFKDKDFISNPLYWKSVVKKYAFQIAMAFKNEN
jgi:nucleoside-diphosphate-sugar epimerase